MSIIKPFHALRPVADKASQVACVPYDVIYDSEVRELVAENPLSFLRVTRAEGEFPTGEKISLETANARAKRISNSLSPKIFWLWTAKKPSTFTVSLTDNRAKPASSRAARLMNMIAVRSKSTKKFAPTKSKIEPLI